MWLAITPEGTRSHTAYWKSGFYRIALAGNLPVGLGYIDYAATNTVGIDTYVTFTGDRAADFALIRAFYAKKRGRCQETQARSVYANNPYAGPSSRRACLVNR